MQRPEMAMTAVGVLTWALVGWGAGGSAGADDRSASQITKEIQSVEMPQLPPKDRGNRQAVREFTARRQAAMERKANLIGELDTKYPNDPSLVQLLPERWQALLSLPRTADQAINEIDGTIAQNTRPKLVNEALALRVLIAFNKSGPNPNFNELMPVVDDFTRRFPADPRGAEMLMALTRIAPDPTTKALITSRVARNYPESGPGKELAHAKASEELLRNAVGKPFPITFRDAIGGKPVNPETLRGKVVVVDFWATWCGPCVAEIPRMKELYAQYKDKGVEFVGVDLDAPRDQGGFDKLKAFVTESKVDWPQYYDGADGQPSAIEFAQRWEINTIPAVFVVGADGNLAAIDGRGRLDTLIPELLAKAGRPVAAPKP